MSELEREYRAALRRYPATWRLHHEEALIGLLLDNAEAEGRTHMSPTERKNLAHLRARLRASRTTAIVLLVIALMLLWHTATLALHGVGLQSQLILTLPQIPATPIGGSSTRTLIEQPAWAVYAISSIAIVAAGVGGTLLMLRNRKIDRKT